MLLGEKNAVIYGAGSALGGALTRAFSRAGARVFLADRSAAAVHALADEIIAAGGKADAAVVDASQKHSVDRHARAVVDVAGSIDVSVNVIAADGLPGVARRKQRPPQHRDLAIHTRMQVLTTTAAARYMVRQRSGVILTLSGEAGDGHSSPAGAACASVQALTRQLAAELGPHGVRVVCLRPDTIPATASRGPRIRPRRSASLDEVADLAVLVAANRAQAATLAAPPSEPPDALKALLGPQRSVVLLMLDTPTTAGRIAEALHTVPGGATHHLRGLEAAGLVTRVRRGQYVIVERTPRGAALLALYECDARRAQADPGDRAAARPLVERHAKARLKSVGIDGAQRADGERSERAA